MKQVSVNELLSELHGDSAVHFSFVKKDGTTRNAVGTLNENLIPKEHIPNESLSRIYVNTKYYDLESGGWRSLSQDCSIINLMK